MRPYLITHCFSLKALVPNLLNHSALKNNLDREHLMAARITSPKRHANVSDSVSSLKICGIDCIVHEFLKIFQGRDGFRKLQ